MSTVEFQGVSKRFGRSASEAVAGVDLEVAEGERFVIVGPSGSGKTTLLRLVAGLEAPTSGEVRIGGRRMDRVAPRRRGVGMVFQHQALYPHLDVAANLGFGLLARKAPRREVAARVAALAEGLGLGTKLRRRPQALSGGERQRVAIGRAVLPGPSVLLLDEPFSGLDAPLRASTRAALLDLHDRAGWTMLLVTHDQTEALAVGRRIAVMRAGRVEQVGTPRELYDRPANRFVAGFLGDPPMSFLPYKVVEGRGEVEGVAGSRIPLDRVARHAPDSAWLGLRPEAVKLGADAPSDVLRGTIERVEPRGHESIAWLRVGPHAVAARFGPRFDGRPGDVVPLGFDPADAHWF